jgi:hypothetical protein
MLYWWASNHKSLIFNKMTSIANNFRWRLTIIAGAILLKSRTFYVIRDGFFSTHRTPARFRLILRKKLMMKLFPLFCAIFFALLGCQGSAQQPTQPNSTASPAVKADPQQLRFNLSTILGTQLPHTEPDELNGLRFRKSYTVANKNSDYGTVIEVQELKRRVEKDSILGGGKYYLTLGFIDIPNIKIVASPDQQMQAISIPSKPGTQFLLRPFGNQPDQSVTTMNLGWYDKTQAQTLARAHTALIEYLNGFEK